MTPALRDRSVVPPFTANSEGEGTGLGRVFGFAIQSRGRVIVAGMDISPSAADG